jgi:hypothetical protein
MLGVDSSEPEPWHALSTSRADPTAVMAIALVRTPLIIFLLPAAVGGAEP